jgi:hypothetical protein
VRPRDFETPPLGDARFLEYTVVRTDRLEDDTSFISMSSEGGVDGGKSESGRQSTDCYREYGSWLKRVVGSNDSRPP